MHKISVVVPALLVAGCATHAAPYPLSTDAAAKVPAVEFHSAFEGYQPFAEPETRDWRRANEAVGAAGGHGGRK
jgi:hypothetical protein